MNLNICFRYLFLFIVLCIVFLFILKFKQNKKNTHKKKNKITETFTQKTMDDVMDYYCENKNPSWHDNYVGWGSTDSNDYKCTFSDCPSEFCWILKKKYMNDNFYEYNSVPIELSKIRENSNCYSNKLKSSISNNIYSCSDNIVDAYANKPDPCGEDPPINSWYFNNIDNQWRNKRLNKFYNSNGDCGLYNIEEPYDKAFYIKLEGNNKFPGDETLNDILKKSEGNSNDKYHYNKSGISCQMKQFISENAPTSGSNYWIPHEYDSSFVTANSPNLFLLDDNIISYSYFHGGFLCENDSYKSFGYSNVGSNIDGTTCGFLDSNLECSECILKKTTCHNFDSNLRKWEKTTYIQTDFFKDNLNETDCKLYKANTNNIDFKALEENLKNKDLGYIDTILLHDVITRDTNNLETVGGQQRIVQTINESFTSNCIITDFSDYCGNSGIFCSILGSNLKRLINSNLHSDENLQNKFDKITENVITDFSDPNYGFYPLHFKEVFKTDGSNCEYCFAEYSGDVSTCISGISNLSRESIDIANTCSYKCPPGSEVKNVGDENSMWNQEGNSYCKKCSESTEYYDSNQEKCIRFTGCSVGKYFDPEGGILKLTNNDGHMYFTSNNTDAHCKNCTGNSYISEITHTKRQCDTCEKIQNHYLKSAIYTVNENKSSCDFCIYNDEQKLDGTNNLIKKYYTEDNGVYKCEVCSDLSTTDVDYYISSIYAKTPLQTELSSSNGNCFKQCHNSEYFSKNIYYSEYPMNSNTYSNCSFNCSKNFFYNESDNQCTACPEGQELSKESKLESCCNCPIGYYNNTRGTDCIECPKINNNPLSKYYNYNPYSSNGSTNINECYYSCLDDNEEPIINSSNNAYYIGSIDSGHYNFTTCPEYSCFAGWKTTHFDDSSGYTLTVVSGEKNPSNELNDFCNSSEVTSFDNKCASGYIRSITNPNSPSPHNYICCKSGTTYDSTNTTCICPTAPSTGLIQSYTWDGTKCDVTCKGQSQKNNNECYMPDCPSGQYIDGDSCTDCPDPQNTNSNNSSVVKSDGRIIDNCYFENCINDNYELKQNISYYTGEDSPPWTDTCVEKKIRCEYYSNVETTNIEGDYKVKGYDNDSISYLKIQRKIIEDLSQSVCDIKKTNSYSTETLSPNVRGYCENSTNIFKPNKFHKFDDSTEYLDEDYNFESPRPIFCCSNNYIGSVGKLNNNSEYKAMCCPTNSNIYIDPNGTTHCRDISCPPPTNIIEYKYYGDIDSSVFTSNNRSPENSNCLVRCLNQNSILEKNNNIFECRAYEWCPSSWQLNNFDSNTGITTYVNSPGFRDTICPVTPVYDFTNCVDESGYKYCCPPEYTYNSGICEKEVLVCSSS